MKNYSGQTPENRFETIVSELVRKVEELKTNQIGTLVLPKLTADPSSPINGQIWVNTTSNQLKIRMNNVTKIVTVT
jgi:hypothetical protein